ncbi:MAG: putative rane protein [Candidatus Eremiobacteraeota bacterium]|nr:putative rane protein [Candidatus Eremiobacteraeota bacterium]
MSAVAAPPRANPFIGLRPFDEEHERLFFGREEQIEKLLERLGSARFLALVGSSGCGKSSLVLAGLLPALKRGWIVDAGAKWRIAKMRPGASPVSALARALGKRGVLADEAPNADASERLATIRHALLRSELGLVDAVFCARVPSDENVLVFVDQFEELFTYAGSAESAANAAEAAAFVKLLLAAAARDEPRIYVAIAMRSDFLGECARFRDLPEAVNDGLFLVPRLTRDEIERAIVEPLRVAGAGIEPRLLSRLLNDIGRDSDQLPVLEHALMRTFDEWKKEHDDGEKLDVGHYTKIGCMTGALSEHADAIYDTLDENDPERAERLRAVAEKLFRCLTGRDNENRGVRRPTAFAAALEITGATQDDLAALVRIYSAPGVSFLHANTPPPYCDAVLDLSHESLMRLWSKLREWVDLEAKAGQTYRDLVKDAMDRAAPWIDPRLAVGQAWKSDNATLINPAWAARYDDEFKKMHVEGEQRRALAAERYAQALAFLDASIEAPLRERAREDAERLRALAAKIRLRRTINAGLGIAAVAITVLILTILYGMRLKQANAEAQAAKATAREYYQLARQFETIAGAESVHAAQARTDAQRQSRIAAAHLDATRRAALDARQQAKNAESKLRRADSQVALARALQTYNAASALLARRDYPGAIRQYDAAIRALSVPGVGTPSDLAQAYFGRADSYNGERQIDLAIADYERALRAKPNFPEAAGKLKLLQAEKPFIAQADATKDKSCTTARKYILAASNDANTRPVAYEAAMTGLQWNTTCGNPQVRLVNEAQLLSWRAAAEQPLHVGDPQRDMARANQLLEQCTKSSKTFDAASRRTCSNQIMYNALLSLTVINAAPKLAIPTPQQTPPAQQQPVQQSKPPGT